MNDKKQLECYLHCCGTANIKEQVAEDMLAEDKPIEDVIKEQDDKDTKE